MSAQTLENLKRFEETKPSNDFQNLLNRPYASIETYVNKADDSLAAIERLGQWIARCGMFGCDRSEQGNIIALSCIELGISLTEFARTYDLVKGKLRKKALAAQVAFEDLGGVVEWIDIGDNGSGKAEAKLTYNGQSRVFSFTVEDAKKAGLDRGSESNWQKWQSEMLCARVLSRGIARLCPRVYAGCEDSDDAPAPVLQLSAPVSHKPEPVATRECDPEPVQGKGEGVHTTSNPTPPAVGAPENHERGQISKQLADEVAVAIGSHQPAAIAWMQRQTPPWITKEQIAAVENPFVFLTEMRAKKIINQIMGFIRNINIKSTSV